MTNIGGFETLDLDAIATVCGGQNADGRVVQIPVERYTGTAYDKDIPSKINEYDVRCVPASVFGKDIPDLFTSPDGQVGEGKFCTFRKKTR